MKLKFILFCLLLSVIKSFVAQERVTTFGIQVKPIIPSELFNTGKQEVLKNNVTFGLAPLAGYSVGMVIRKGFTKNISVESGINYLKRKFELSITDDDNNFREASTYGLINYEIPISLLVYTRLSQFIYMNASGGVALDVYPSDLYSYSENFRNDLFMYNWIRSSLIANIGWEYRSEKSGYFYVGGSYHRPFAHMAKEVILYNGNNKDESVSLNLSGNYITVDFRYFFHEDPERKIRKVKKPKSLQ